MPSLQNKALLIGLEIDLAQNNVRRNLLSFNVGIQSINNDFEERNLTIQPTLSYTFLPTPSHSVTLVRVVGGKLNVRAQNTQNTMLFDINSLWVYTDKLTSLEFTNPSTETAIQLFIVQL
jgi:hypothetical protein